MTIYYPESDTLHCGCDPDWPDHRCRYGCSRCGAPDDCYCPSRAEEIESTLQGRDIVYPAIFHFQDDIHHLKISIWICYSLSDAVQVLYDVDLLDGTLLVTDASDNGTRVI